MSDEIKNTGYEIGWEDEISNESEFTVLPEDDYDFEVVKFERGRSKGSDKLPPSNMAILTLRVTGNELSATLTDQLVLHSKMEWKLCQFFRAIGQKKHNEPLRMKWNEVTGAKGRCKVRVEKWTGNDGNERESNRIDKYYDSDTVPVPAAEGQKKYW